MENFKKCKSFSEMGKLLGYNYYNGRVKKEIMQFCFLHEIDPEEIIKTNSKTPNKCLYCGKELEGRNKFTKKFCNSSCAASYNNNKREPISDITKEKIRKTLIEKYTNGNLKPHNLQSYKLDGTKYAKIQTCVVCGTEFEVPRRKDGRYSQAKTCSNECKHQLMSTNSKNTMARLINEGRHQGWKSRNIISYPEQFWMNVLSNNNISFQHNFVFDKYFLDFFIEVHGRKIDLEIDGKQHEYEDRQEKDIERDMFVSSKGLEVYRIKWNNINTDDGRKEMQEKIKAFLAYINR